MYWVRLPDESSAKRRPALVLSPTIRNELASDVIVVPISSTLREAPTHVRLRRGEGGLPRASMVKAEQITTVAKHRLVGGPLGVPLTARQMVMVERAVLAAIGVALPDMRAGDDT